MWAQCRNARGTKEWAHRQRNTEKWFPLFRRLAQLLFRMRPRLRVWNCTLTRLSRHKLLTDSFHPFAPLSFHSFVLSISVCYSPFVFFLMVSRGQFTVNWTPIISRVAGVSLYRRYSAFCTLSLRCASFSIFTTLFLSLSLFLWQIYRVYISDFHLLFIFIRLTFINVISGLPLLPHLFSLPFIALGLTVC